MENICVGCTCDEQFRGIKMGVNILAIESSCDETAAAVVEDGRKVKSNIIY